MSTSQQIRDLHIQGVSNSEISRTLNIHYQHVYGVLNNAKYKKESTNKVPAKKTTLSQDDADTLLDMYEVGLNEQTTTSAKIRFLHKMGLDTSTIARLLNIRYQHAYQVLKMDGLLKESDNRDDDENVA